MPSKGDTLYCLNSKQQLEPVIVKSCQEIDRTSPEGEPFSDTMVTVENQKQQISTNFAYHFQYVPYIHEIEAELAQVKAKSP
jgi:hypothetical protein